MSKEHSFYYLLGEAGSACLANILNLDITNGSSAIVITVSASLSFSLLLSDCIHASTKLCASKHRH